MEIMETNLTNDQPEVEVPPQPEATRDAIRAKLESCNRGLLEVLGDISALLSRERPKWVSDRYAELRLAAALNEVAHARLLMRRRRRHPRGKAVPPSGGAV